MEDIRAISLWQPWASLWVAGIKIHETRHWFTDYRGPLAVHAAMKYPKDLDVTLKALLVRHFKSSRPDLPRGQLVGVVDLVDCVRTETCFPAGGMGWSGDDYVSGNFAPNRYAWRAANPRVLIPPTPWKGHQGFFSVPADVIAQGLRR